MATDSKPGGLAAWLSPGIIMSLVSAAVTIGGTVAVVDYRLQESDRRLTRVESQLGQITAVQQDTIEAAVRLSNLSRDIERLDSKTEALRVYYDTLNTRLARQEAKSQ